MIKKVLLISSNFEEFNLQSSSKRLVKGSQTQEAAHYPLSLSYLHSILEKDGLLVGNLFLNNHSNEDCQNEVMSYIDSERPEVVGFQMLTNNRVSTLNLIESIHKKYPKIHLIIGGIHASIMYEQIIKKYNYVIAVIGEGELTLSEFIRKLSNENKDIQNIKGIAFNQNGKVIKTDARPPIENLDSLPWPKHEVFFKNSNRNTGCILTTRGCPFNCSFCCLDVISNRRVRMRSIKNVVDEIEWMVNKFPKMGKVWIQDDSFFINNQRVIDFCNEVLSRKMRKVKFICSGRMTPLSEEMVNKLVEANFEKVYLGLETANEEMLKKCHKGIKKVDVVRAFKMFAKTNIITRMFLIVGLPGETLETVKETINFTKKIQKIKYLYFGESFPVLSIFPGTEIYDIAKNGGLINDDYWLTNKPTPPFTLEHDYDELLEYKELMLDNLSLDRTFTSFKGFINQVTMLPKIIPYIIRHRIHIHVLSTFLRKMLPNNLFIFTKKIYNSFK